MQPTADWDNPYPLLTPDLNDPLPALLEAEREALITGIVERVRREIPDYAAAPLGVVTARFTAIVNDVIRSLVTRDPSPLTQPLERTTRKRLAQGYSITALIIATNIVGDVFSAMIRRCMADDPQREAIVLRRISNLIGTSRSVISRCHLAAVVNQMPQRRTIAQDEGE